MPFDEQLLDHIRNGRNDEANAMLTGELAQVSDESNRHMTLLHHAMSNDKNVFITQRLIELGANVDSLAGRGTTPLMLAVAHGNPAVLEVLLEADASIDQVDDDGCSALKVGLNVRVDPKVFTLLVRKLKGNAPTNVEMAETLIRAGCNLSHAATLRDSDVIGVMECMLERGVHINSRGPLHMTALHVIGELGDVNVAAWLLRKGIYVDARDQEGCSTLRNSVWSGDKDVVQLLLEHGANPNLAGHFNVDTVLYAAYLHIEEFRTDGGLDKFVECAELLLQHRASLGTRKQLLGMLNSALNCSCNEAVKLLIAHMAMLEMLDTRVDKSIFHSVAGVHQTKMSELSQYYEPCQQVLAITMFVSTSLLDLLQKSDRKMRLLARKETFFQEVDRISSEHKLEEVHSYYYNLMMKRVEKASRVVKLEDEAILVICKLLEVDYNQFYGFARGVVECLSEYDLENLVHV